MAAVAGFGAVHADAAEGFDFFAAEQTGGANDLGEILFASEVGRLVGLEEDEFFEESLFRGFEMGEVGIAVAVANGERDSAGFAQREGRDAGLLELAKDFVERAGNEARHRVGQGERGVDGLDAQQRFPSLLDGGASLTQGVEDFRAHTWQYSAGRAGRLLFCCGKRLIFCR